MEKHNVEQSNMGEPYMEQSNMEQSNMGEPYMEQSNMEQSNFVAVDFETATNTRMICEIGIVEVVNGKIVSKYQSLVQPPDNEYDWNILGTNYVTPEMTEGKPTFKELWPEISRYFEGRTIFSHNASFDRDVLRKNIKRYAIPTEGIKDFGCTERYTYGSRLGVACRYFGIPFDEKQHHNALYDAEACAAIALHLLNEEVVDFERITEIKEAYKKEYPSKPRRRSRKTGGVGTASGGHNSASGNYSSTSGNYSSASGNYSSASGNHSSASEAKIHHIELPKDANPDDPSNPLAGKKFVLTGTFRQDRKTLTDFFKNVMKAIPTNTVSKNTSFFFIGEAPGGTKMGEYEKLQHNGYEVPTFYQHDVDEIISGVWEPYQHSGTVKNLNFTYHHYTRHRLVLRQDRNLLASREVYLGEGLRGNRIYFDIILGNLGAFDPVELDKDTNICILSDSTLRKLQQGEKDETIQYLENFYNNNRARVFDFSFVSESDLIDFVKTRCEQCGDELTRGYLVKYLEGGEKGE